MKTRRWLLLLTAVALVAPVLLALENESARRDQLKRLRGAIRAYNGLYPDKPLAKLSALIDESFLEGPGALMRPGATAVPPRAELDARADYTLEPLAGARDLVVRERTPLPGETEVLAMFSDGNIRALAAPVGGTTVASAPAPNPPSTHSTPAPNSVVPPPEVAGAPSSPAVSQPFSVPTGAATSPPSNSTPTPTTMASPPEMTRSLPAARDAAPISAPQSTPAVRAAPPPAPQFGVSSTASAPPPAGVTTRGDIPPEMMAALVQFLKGQNNPGQAQTQTSTSAPRNFGMTTTPDGRTTVTLQAPDGSQPATVSIPPTPRSDGTTDATAVALQMLAQFGQGIAARQQKAAQEQDAALAANNALAQNPQELFKMYGTDMSAFNRATAAVSASPAQPTPQVSSSRMGMTSPPATSTPGAVAGQWRVTHQLVTGLPWISATWSKKQADDARAAAQASRDDRRIADSFRDAGGWGRANDPTGGYYQAFEMALYTLQEKAKLGKVPEVAFALNNIAVAATEKDITGAAEPYFSEAREIWEQLTNSGRTPNEDYAVMLHNYAALKNKMGDASGAAQLESRAESILAQLGGAAPAAGNRAPAPATGSAPAATPGKWNVTHQLVQGLPWPSASWPEQQVLARVKDAEATPDQRLVNALNDLAGWHRGQGRLQEAYDTYYRVMDVQRKRGLAEHPDYALVLNDEGVILTEAKDYRQAERNFEAAKQMWEKYWTAPLPPEDYAVLLHNYGYLARLAGDSGKAAALEAKAAEIMETRRRAIGN